MHESAAVIVMTPLFAYIYLFHRFRLLVHEARQSGPLGAFVQADAAQAVDDPALRAQQVQIAGAAHQLSHQRFPDREAHLVGAVKEEGSRPLHGGLGDFRQLGTHEMLAQQHTEHGRLRRIFRGGGGQMEPGRGGIGGEEQLFPALPAAKM